ncbi:GntR family transcriptional regulator [Streptomyces netropsis]|uniref:GntR family transcriptional regulator n=1 Tax=Streptomyces netropsis TaxID=55404 RepID=A0A7W7LI95_STRNE|nr:GntR family transcriptional regulator [Streptomyces netropsis]MBB4890768.1 GntR family transcriptional regulator [Streptomyces netropsis]GGR51855.1 transcriptional regulator [Streptomyces netropsis]
MAKRYELIADDLRQQIGTGTIESDARLPTETALSSQYRVGLPTVRQALSVLQAEGLIEKRHGRGNFVRRSRQQLEYANDRNLPEADSTRRHEPTAGSDTDVTVSCCELGATDELASRLGVPVGTRLLEFTYRSQRVEDDAPYSIVRSYMVRAMVAEATMAPVSDRSPWGDAYREWFTGTGIELDHVVERLTARPPSADEALALGIAPGVSVVAIQRTSVDTRGVVVETADLLLSGDRVAAVYTTPVIRARQLC